MKKILAVFMALLLTLPLLFSLPTAVLADPTDDYAVLTPVGQTQATVKVTIGQVLTDNCTVRSISGNIIYVDLNPRDNWSGHTYNQLWQLPYASDLWYNVGTVESIENIASAQYNLHEGANTMLQNGQNIINYHFKETGGGGGGNTHLHNFWLAFDANGGTGAPATIYKYSDDTYHSSEPITIPNQEPTWEGHTFLGWSRTPDGTADYHAGNNVIVYDGETVTLYAVWEAEAPATVQYTVKHLLLNSDGMGGEYDLPDDILYGVPGEQTNAVPRTIVGFTNNDFYQNTIAADGSTVITITYQRNVHQLTWDPNGGTITTPEAEYTKNGPYDYGWPITAPAVEREGYTFVGWTPAYVEGATMPDNDLTYTAQWESNMPDKPTPGVVQHIKESSIVATECSRQGNNHPRYNTELYDNSFTIGEVAGNAADGYTCLITVNPEQYVAKYNEWFHEEYGTVDHIYDESAANVATFTMDWDAESSQWVYNGDTTGFIVHFFVICPETYTVTWVNHDGTVLETDNEVPANTMPNYDGAAPEKPDDQYYTYDFTGWDPEVSPVTRDITYTAQFSAIEKDVVFVFNNLRVYQDISVGFFVKLSDAALNAPGAKIRFTVNNGGDSGRTVEIPIEQGEDRTVGDVQYKVFFCPVNAKEMANRVTAEFVSETLNPGETNSCSVRDYAQKVFDRSDIYGADHPLTKLIKSTLNYGAAAQVLFGYKTDDLANSIMNETDRRVPPVNFAELGYGSGIASGALPEGITCFASLMLEDLVKVRFKVNGNISGLTFKLDGENVELTLDPDGENSHYVETRGLYYTHLHEHYDFCILSDGEEVCRISYGAFDYGAAVQGVTEPDAALVAVMQAMYDYHLMAKAYWHD